MIPETCSPLGGERCDGRSRGYRGGSNSSQGRSVAGTCSLDGHRAASRSREVPATRASVGRWILLHYVRKLVREEVSARAALPGVLVLPEEDVLPHGEGTCG